jgi:hypothetical protein
MNLRYLVNLKFNLRFQLILNYLVWFVNSRLVKKADNGTRTRDWSLEGSDVTTTPYPRKQGSPTPPIQFFILLP